MKEKIAVIGGGAWGTALADLAAQGGRQVEIYLREEDVVHAINAKHENTVFLPGYSLSKDLKAFQMDDFNKCDAKNVIWSVPTQFSRLTARQYKSSLEGRNILNASKGIEIDTGMLVLELMKEEVNADFSIISGPSFAKEVAAKQATAVSLGAKSKELAGWWQKELSTDYFRIYTSSDVISLEVGGAIKNVIAVATGISDGLKFEHNARAALITRGLAESARFGVAYGGKRETFMGLSGLGDLVLTATGDTSRNRQMGLKIAQGLTVEQASKELKTVSEGVATAKAVYLVSRKRNIEMPICTEVYKIIYEGKDPRRSAVDLMRRPLVNEDEL